MNRQIESILTSFSMRIGLACVLISLKAFCDEIDGRESIQSPKSTTEQMGNDFENQLKEWQTLSRGVKNGPDFAEEPTTKMAEILQIQISNEKSTTQPVPYATTDFKTVSKRTSLRKPKLSDADFLNMMEELSRNPDLWSLIKDDIDKSKKPRQQPTIIPQKFETSFFRHGYHENSVKDKENYPQLPTQNNNYRNYKKFKPSKLKPTKQADNVSVRVYKQAQKSENVIDLESLKPKRVVKRKIIKVGGSTGAANRHKEKEQGRRRQYVNVNGQRQTPYQGGAKEANHFPDEHQAPNIGINWKPGPGDRNYGVEQFNANNPKPDLKPSTSQFHEGKIVTEAKENKHKIKALKQHMDPERKPSADAMSYRHPVYVKGPDAKPDSPTPKLNGNPLERELQDGGKKPKNKNRKQNKNKGKGNKNKTVTGKPDEVETQLQAVTKAERKMKQHMKDKNQLRRKLKQEEKNKAVKNNKQGKNNKSTVATVTEPNHNENLNRF